MGILLLLLLFSGFAFGSFVIALIYRGMYKKLRYLALSGCEFKERKGDLVARHPLMKEGRWELLTEAYSFAAKPRNHRELEELAEPGEEDRALTNGESEQYEPGSWKTKENALEE
ncbi:MAG: hypothetical protein R2681_03260 [Pyrinomonadaceae bacterium]